MKKGVTITILIFIALVFFGALYYLYAKNQESPIVFQTDKAEIKTIVKNTIATGNIVPDEEVLIKPNISGIIEEVYIKAGETIKAGDLGYCEAFDFKCASKRTCDAWIAGGPVK